jgi:integrase
LELIAASPCASLDRRLLFKNVKIEPRQRVLSEAEIRAFWIASEKLGYPYGPFYRLLLLTGVRVSELSKAQWAEFHPELRRRLREATKAGTAVDGRRSITVSRRGPYRAKGSRATANILSR